MSPRVAPATVQIFSAAQKGSAIGMRVYHFTTAQYGLEDIAKQRLKIATLQDLNDPFELRSVVVKSAVDRKAYNEFRDRAAERYGILCFSKSWQDPVQWSHYAERHRGVCLGFDVEDHLLLEVHYRATRFSQKLLERAVESEQLGEDFVITVMRTKYRRWAYEQEWRVICPLQGATDGGLYFAPMNDQVRLREVIIGAASRVTRAEVAEALSSNAAGVAVKNSRLSFRQYQVVTQRDPQFWT